MQYLRTRRATNLGELAAGAPAGHLPRTTRSSVVFGPDEIRVMRTALDRSWEALSFARWQDDMDKRRTRERLARAILHEAARGERSIGTLTDNALGSLEPRSS